MSNNVTIQGFASSDVELDTKESGLVVGRLRMGSTHRMQDPITRLWVDGETNWYRINLFRTLAHNVAASVKKGDRIVVIGRLRIKTWLKPDGSHGVGVEIDADTVANDLKFGTCTYHRGGNRNGASTGSPNAGTAPEGAGTPGAFSPQPDGADGAAPDHPNGHDGHDGQPGFAPAPVGGSGTGSAAPPAPENSPGAVDPGADDADPNGDYLAAGDEMNVNTSTGELLDATPPPY